MRNYLRVLLVMALLASSMVSLAFAAGWTTYRADEYGFQMLVPPGTSFSEEDFGGGWGGMTADVEGVRILAIGRLGAPASAEEIESYGVKVTGIPAGSWKKLDEGKGTNGWKWYRGVKAQSGDDVAFGGYGVGPKGSYLLLVRTTASDYAANKADYEKWYNSLKVF